MTGSERFVMAIEAPLFRFKAERPNVMSEVCRRAFNEFVSLSKKGEAQGLEYVLNEAAFMELARMSSNGGDEIRSAAWWRSMSRRLAGMSEAEKRETLWGLTESYTQDIAGKFNPLVYKAATGVLPIGLSFLFKTQDLKDMPLPTSVKHIQSTMRHIRDLTDRVLIEGEIETLKALARKGTLVFVPTHSSNMDSILLGWSLYEAGLPPVSYGAGKNLFSNPLTGFFMSHLGAYKVDRRIQHQLYKETLKIYSQVLLERGYHSLFFPGGTRCRSNRVETQLKMGLLGTVIPAYINRLQSASEFAHKPLYICPVTINYNLILEAASLIDDHLRSEGRGRYMLENDEFNQISTVTRFVMNTVGMDSTTVIRFGAPMDPFGNVVRADGLSYDNHGRQVDPSSYVRSARTGEIGHDDARDRQYTRHTAERIGQAFLENTVIMPTQLVAYALFSLLDERYPQWDVFRLIRFGSDEVISWEELHKRVEQTLEQLKEMEAAGKLRLSAMLMNEKADSIVYDGLENLRMYHIPPVVERYTDGVMLHRVELVYFYANRVLTYLNPL